MVSGVWKDGDESLGVPPQQLEPETGAWSPGQGRVADVGVLALDPFWALATRPPKNVRALEVIWESTFACRGS